MADEPGDGVVETDLVVRADPDKSFFIENLVKDIELIPAILDLVDNSVDSARQIALAAQADLGKAQVAVVEDDSSAPKPDDPVELPPNAYLGLEVHLRVSSDSFEIVDNCAGMNLDVARRYAFRIGRAKGFEGVPGSVGQFGVGMKRALFKVGRWFSVTSRSESEWFELEVDVDDWLAEQDDIDWTFRFKSALSGLETPSSLERGTTIRVERIHSSVRDDFQDDTILGLLREQLRLRHQEAIDSGLRITLNGKDLRGLRPELLSGPNFKPIKRVYVLDSDAGSVTVEVIAGIVKSDRREIDDGEAENFRSTGEAGWWVFCNDRLLLVADKSPETGWGNGAAAYHPQYRLFRGYVYMSSLNTSLLPWNTTKTGVDADSRTWRRVQALMVSSLVEVQAVLNRLKKEREAQLGDDDDINNAGDDVDAPYTRALEASHSVPLRQLERTQLVVPSIVRKAGPPRRRVWQKLQYEVPRDQFEKAMTKLKFATAADLGRRSFSYFYKREVDDE